MWFTKARILNRRRWIQTVKSQGSNNTQTCMSTQHTSMVCKSYTMAFISCVLRGYPSQPRHFPKSSESTEELTDSVSADPSQRKSMDSSAKTQLCSNFEKTLRREPAPFCSKDKKTSFSGKRMRKQRFLDFIRVVYIRLCIRLYIQPCTLPRKVRYRRPAPPHKTMTEI